MTLAGLTEMVARFADQRDWGQFHSPKNLVMALAGEVGELAAEFQWLSPEESFDVIDGASKGAAVQDEIADVVLYLVRLADVLGVDLLAVARAKLERNEVRFPAEQARQRSAKYRDLRGCHR